MSTAARLPIARAIACASAIAVLVGGCTGGADQGTPEATPSTFGCPIPGYGPVDAASVLVPGPTDGLPPTQAKGERLVVVAVVLTAGCVPAPGASVTVWHTDARGDYRPSGDNRCCYYRGTIHTDQNGRFRLETIRPAEYNQPNAPPPAHIHVEVHHPSGELMTEIVFTTDPTRPEYALPGTNMAIYLASTATAPSLSWYGEATLVLSP
jgi:protocatechuate 3,4-dioxygenase beta subunit